MNVTSNAPFPWQQQYWELLVSRIKNHTLPHGLLVSGPTGMGKSEFAIAIATLLLCTYFREHHYQRCNNCHSCQLINAESHPDLIYIQGGENDELIKLEQIRELIEQIGKSAQQGGYKVVIIAPAHRMNIASANALLKTLEEPPKNTLIILVTAFPALLPATIRSRCQQLHFRPLALSKIQPWLEGQLVGKEINSKLCLYLAGGRPLLALSLANGNELTKRQQLFVELVNIIRKIQNPIKLADTWQHENLFMLLDWLDSWISDIIRVLHSGLDNYVINKDSIVIIKKLSQRTQPAKLFFFLDQLAIIRRQLQHKFNLNQQLLLENIFFSWTEIFS